MITDSNPIVNLSRQFFDQEMLKKLIYKNCILCGTASNQSFCNPCFNSLPALSIHHCSVCLKKMAANVSGNEVRKCGTCLTKPPAYNTTIAALSYTFPVDALIHALKYQAQLAIAPILAELLIGKLNPPEMPEKPALIIPMPLHPKRLQERGFNQALEIAQHVSQRINVPLSTTSCERIKNTLPQTKLPWKSRQKNVRKAFSCQMDLTGKHVAVIDDVMTTGATLNELAQLLRKQGATEITNWVIARVRTDKPFQSQRSNTSTLSI